MKAKIKVFNAVAKLAHNLCLSWISGCPKMIKSHLLIASLTLVMVLGGFHYSQAATIDFEGLSDSTSVTDHYTNLGITFLGATVFTAGKSLNELECPPHSGSQVVMDGSGPITIIFNTKVSKVSANFTYNYPLTLSAYNSSNLKVATVTSRFSSNMALSGDLGSKPNELLQLRYSGGIAKLVIAGEYAGGSFTLDDLTISDVFGDITSLLNFLLYDD
jgi:hypothetical protein